MSELLEIYELDGTLIEIKDRKVFYQESREEFTSTGRISKKTKTVRVLLMSSIGRIYLQKRSELKAENANLYDKTVGGHVEAGSTFELTVIKECAEELGFPSTIVSDSEFSKAVKSVDLNIIGILKKVDHLETYNSERIQNDGARFVQPYITDIYVGYYDGPIKFVDGESSGIETFSLAQLEKEISNHSDKFTEDLKYMVKNYSSFLVPIN